MDLLVALVPPFHEYLAAGGEDVSIHSLLFKYCLFRVILTLSLSHLVSSVVCRLQDQSERETKLTQININ